MNEGELSRAAIARLCGCSEREIPNEPAFSLTNFVTPGPVAERYVRSSGPIDVITGPAGSGKTVASIFKTIRFAVGVMPQCNDGAVRLRLTVIRDNYRALYRTTLRSWFEFFPPSFRGSTFSGGQDRPAQHVLKLAAVRGGREVPVDIIVDFFAVGDVAIEELLKGYETSAFWCNEADLLHHRVIPFCFSRTGRYPKLADLPPGTVRPRMVTADMNPPDMDHPLWRACLNGTFQEVEEPLPADQRTVNFFQQPSGLAADAENRLGKSYEAYELESRTLPKQEVRRFVHGKPGYALDGRPVYGEDFDERRHVAGGTLAVLPTTPLDIGFDQGLSPGAVLFQTASTGQVRILAELIPPHGTGAARFLEMLLVLLTGRFRGVPPGLYGSDPSGFYGADTMAGELSWAEMISKGLAHPVIPAPSNEPAVRIEAVRLVLRQNISPEVPALLIDPSCRLLISGFAAHYKFRRIRDGASDRFEDRPHKNNHATAHDALQYGVLTRRGRAGTIDGVARAGRPAHVVPLPRNLPKPGDFDVFAV